MFKKSVEAKLHQRLSGADKKKLKRTIKLRFPRASDDHIDQLLPPKAEIVVGKFQNKVHVYSVEGGFPMFFDVDGRGTEIFPTVFALWIVPELLPCFILKGGEVSRYVIGGADLMFPGIFVPHEGLPPFEAGEPWAVKVPGNPAPIAVGSTFVSSEQAIRAGMRGKALRITHYYRDLLWESSEGHYVPNAGFLGDVVLEDPDYVSSGQASNLCDSNNEDSNDQLIHPNNELPECNVVNDIIGSDSPSAAEIDSQDCAADKINVSVDALKLRDNDSVNESTVEEQQHALSTQDMDAYLDKCLLQALHISVKDNDLPLPGSTLWSNHVLPCRSAGVTLDIKKSSHKKLSKWLQAKSSTGLIAVKEDKYKKETMLISVNRSHPDYLSFKPEKRQELKHDQTSEAVASDSRSHKLLEVVEIYKPSVHVNPIFASVGADTGRLYSAAEASEVVFKYVEKENLVKPTNKALVVLDPTLCDALFKGAIKKGSAFPTEIHKKDLGSTFIGRMQAHNVVSRGGESVVRKGALKNIQIVTERRQGNKKVTRLSGLEMFLIDAESLASELQKKFACSTTTAELPGKKGQEVIIQGGVIEDVARHLVEQYGVGKRYIEVLDKTKK